MVCAVLLREHTNVVTERQWDMNQASLTKSNFLRNIVTHGPARSCAMSITAIAAAANKMKVTGQSTRALTASFGTSRNAHGGNGASVSQVVGFFPSGVERIYQHSVDQLTNVAILRTRTH